mmetsp:Transcript_1773/g.4438  ORF Transcript_1773/g.4438 Transcript_1773/m.4438 type:complete len:531 (+) Transcript_1773:24-1616(+)
MSLALLLLSPQFAAIAYHTSARVAARNAHRATALASVGPRATPWPSSYEHTARVSSVHESPSWSEHRSFSHTLCTILLAFVVSLPSCISPSVMAHAAQPQAVIGKATTMSTAVPAEEARLPSTSVSAAASVDSASKPTSRRYINLTGFPFPLGPFLERKTVETVLVPNKVYSFEQEQQLSGITANVRSTVFRMRDNTLLVYNPVAPTEEFLSQLAALHGDGVSHILLGSTAYEHKIFVGPFARKFPSAKVWAVPDQWSFPLDLPAPLLGINTKGSGGGELIDTTATSAAYAKAPDLTAEFEVKLLRPAKRLGFRYAANEAALFHKDTKTLALTDALVYVPASSPEIYDRANLLAVGDNARNSNSLGNIILKGAGAVNWRGTASQEVEALFSASDSAAREPAESQLQRGWERNTLLSLYFGPSPTSLIDPTTSFNMIREKWIVAPVTDSLIYRSERVKPELARWVEDVARWDFKTIAPAHFAAGPGTADDLRNAFSPTLKPEPRETRAPYNENDVRLLDDLATLLRKRQII